MNPPPYKTGGVICVGILLDRFCGLLLQLVTLRWIALSAGELLRAILHEEARHKARALRSEVELALYLRWFIEEFCD